MCEFIKFLLEDNKKERTKCLNILDEYKRIIIVMNIFDEKTIDKLKMENGLSYRQYYEDNYIKELKRCEKYI